MSVFLESLDQWALGVLMGICTLFGVQDLPSYTDPDWKLEESWTPVGEYYRLVMSSESIQKKCRSGRANYIIFPQTYMGKQEIFADNIRVYTNEMDQDWFLKSIFDRPAISCDFFGYAKKIDFVVVSYEKYFASITKWPFLSDSYPKTQIFYSVLYAIVGILSAVSGVIFFLIATFLGEKGHHILFLSLSIFLLMCSHHSAYLLLPTSMLHTKLQ